jgi:hypothetical protein
MGPFELYIRTQIVCTPAQGTHEYVQSVSHAQTFLAHLNAFNCSWPHPSPPSARPSSPLASGIPHIGTSRTCVAQSGVNGLVTAYPKRHTDRIREHNLPRISTVSSTLHIDTD